MRCFLSLGLCLAMTAVLSAAPDILFIVTDDQNPETIHALGNERIRTPNLDRLAAGGTAFTRAYAGYPICHVSRAEILTGCTPFRAYMNYPAGPIDPALKTMAQTFQEAGYLTWYSGKWHNDGHPKQRGYTGTRGLYSSGGVKGEKGPAMNERGQAITGYTGWTFKSDDDGKAEPEKGIGLQADNSVHVANGAIRAIADTPADKRFLLHVNFAFPHDPRQWPADETQRYDPAHMKLPENFAPVHPFDHGNLHGRDETLLPIPREEAAVLTELAIYYAMISDVDNQIGRILEALEKAGRKDTIIVFISDQGLAMGSHGLLGKQNQYEHSIRSPLIIAGSELPKAKRTQALVHLRDLYPTFCELAGIAIPGSVQGRSLLPLLQGKTERVHDFVTGTFTDTQRMICDERWKFIRYPQLGREQLFDLESDPHEMKDLSADPAHDEKKAGMKQKLQAWLKEQGDPLGQTGW
ncbi:sulfatase-like hydrolase/transferase [Prosthecobacter sp. SYSU 5D2]|uniref:sulfatase-like hydrolase/transferase n=1 Tax=Prosthecobacter sp. SYSU 5D2 TaxID=3134134 RepID=UPI0031FE8C3F